MKTKESELQKKGNYMTDRIKEIKNKSESYLNCKSSFTKSLSDFFAVKDIFYLLSEVERLQQELADFKTTFLGEGLSPMKWVFDIGTDIEKYIRARCKDEKAADEVWAVYYDCDAHAGDFAMDCDRLQKENDEFKRERLVCNDCIESGDLACKENCPLIKKMRKALKSVIPFFAEDMPDGPDSDSCASNEYRESYRLVLEALKDLEEANG